jgi:hypothetical protein
MGRHRFTPRTLLAISALIVLVIIATIVFATSQQPTTAPNVHVVVFDFDSGAPSLETYQSTPFSQTKDNVTVSFSSPSDLAAFSVSNNDADSLILSQFSGKYLSDNKTSRDILDIKFSEQMIDLKITFATVEEQSQDIQIPSDVVIAVYNGTRLVGSNRAYGSFSSDSYPQGTITFFAGMQFNWIRVSIPPQSSNTTDFLIDNITVTLVSKNQPSS